MQLLCMVVETAYYTAGAAYAELARRRELGTSIFDADWDICIVLDSTRSDMLANAADAYLDGYDWGTRWSLGSVTTEWLASTFRESRRDEIGDTTLVTAHPHTATVLDEREWLTSPGKAPVPYPDIPTVEAAAFGAVYRTYEHAAGTHGVVGPEYMADATIAAYREHGDRVVAHWLQPHEPFIAPDTEVVGGAALEGNVWEGLAAGTLDAAAVWQSYMANLRYALEHVALVTKTVDARILVTADHGNLWDVAGQYGHPFGMWHPQVRRVPWLGVDTERAVTYEPAVDLGASADTDSTDQLEALGYA